MASETQKEGMLSGMSTKQKVIAVLLVIITLIVLWQVIGMFSGSSSAPIVAEPTHKPAAGTMNSNTPVASAATSPVNTPTNPMMAQGTTPTIPQLPPTMPEQPQVRESAVTMDNQILEIQKKSEEKYIDQLNQLQMLKVQREIAETNQAIASARLATVTAEKNVSDLLTRPTTPQNSGAPGALTMSGAESYAILTGQSIPTASPPPSLSPPEPQPQPTTTVVVPPPVIDVPYSVISISMQLGKWNAVVALQDKLFNVSIGDVLPPDGSIVASINKNGVVLIKDRKRRRVSITSSI